MPSNKKLLQAAAGNAGESLYVEDVFSTYVYEGTGAAQSIDNGISLSDEGGLVWIKSRSNADNSYLFDTVNGPEETLSSDATNAGADYSDYWDFPSAGTQGFNLLDAPGNYAGWTLASWSFRKADKFFDVVAYTGNSVNGRQLPHNLGSTPGMVVCKRIDTGQNWILQHRSLDLSSNKTMYLNSTDALAVANDYWNSTHASDTAITLSGNADINGTGGTYVAYVFAHNAGGFGDDADENIISCGSYTGAGANLEVNVGFEPQFVLIKCTTNAGTNWVMFDTMRGLPVDGNAKDLRPNVHDAEGDNSAIGITSTGFLARNGIDGQINANGRSYIYVAIRRPMKTPESGTEVFAVDQASNSVAPKFRAPFAVDMAWYRLDVSGTELGIVADRLRGEKELNFDTTFSEGGLYAGKFDYMNGWNNLTGANSASYSWMLKRATGFMDAVAYKGNGTAGTAQAHNLGVVPEMMIAKNRSNSSDWAVYHTGSTYAAAVGLKLNTTAAGGSNTYDFGNASGGAQRPDASSVYLGGNVNSTNDNYILYLFATLAGVSKVGSYTGTAADLNVDCGFSAGARFILIKRTDSTGDWYYWDSVRGIVAGNDPYLLMNSNAAQVTNTDYVDPLSSGFTVTSSAPAALNASGGTYIFLAIA